MAEQLSEEELVENIKKWLKDNGIGIALGLAIGLGGVAGWDYWTDYQQAKAEQASAYFDAFMEAVKNNDIPKARADALVLLDEYSDSTYAVMTALALAKIAVQKGENDKAIEKLEWALAHTEEPALLDIVRLRLARVLLAEERFSDVENHLGRVINASFVAEREELRGDLHVARDELDKARNAYEAARAALGPGRSASLLQMKLDDINS